MKVDHYVTAWGFPGLRWWDTISNMTGNPLTDHTPAVSSHKVERRMWINADGLQVLALDEGKPAVVGHWNEFERLVMGTTRIDLSSEKLRQLQNKRLQWVEHHVLEAHFSDGTVNRVAQSDEPEAQFRNLHGEIARTFIEHRPAGRFIPPKNGHCLPGENIVEAHLESLEPGEENRTGTNLSEQEWKARKWKGGKQVGAPSFEWHEPIATKGLFRGRRYHILQRILHVGRGARQDQRSLWFHTYRPDGNVIAACADFALLEGFRLVKSNQVLLPEIYKPMPDMEDGHTIVADFRYGYQMPLMCAVCEEYEVEALRGMFQRELMPLVGKKLSDQDLGLPPRDHQ